jgi:hypothetical protein
LGTAAQFHDSLAERGMLTHPFGAQLLRAVTHLDVSRTDIERACEILEEVVGARPAAAPSTAKAKSGHA